MELIFTIRSKVDKFLIEYRRNVHLRVAFRYNAVRCLRWKLWLTLWGVLRTSPSGCQYRYRASYSLTLSILSLYLSIARMSLPTTTTWSVFESVTHGNEISTENIVTNFGFNMIGNIFYCSLNLPVIYLTIYMHIMK